ncbi:tetrapyrrole (corrin porphyrin) methyltransferase [Paucilactobacillus oligofermentans DSM 15707 = LMG 22743]|uniref:Ribosomal RNA small subunit methyltransferase I n=1 Tax=Paucilactobacillus oligofermentans DSM 15707 = LMG 22743 TaxID=1423778 RepID=A0A0R1RKV9_9LACO|nr:16S rRNA (cytidine(1402)-2'-O)-methyltransferase [Paucilactobacillus oligofermentans]KRL57808.1 tetrapyrrole (corrin porphyrin) methyltransferase [Paucilactobacillus oligofermentans DSM 15707 = LMG 22743]CUS26734.1 Ribosomal RNA small subunit methyltransferase I [Paucilactobacillus oligofermentans DSM 15707 = LMG 22743]
MQRQHSFDQTELGTLYLVPTPIGNLQDMTFRAVDTLKKVDLIAAEDTRNTQKLLNHFEVETKQISFHEHNTAQRIPQLVEKLLNGDSIAQVSDAGMPSISDPGKELVAACIEHDIPVVPLPGANAGLTALIASGLEPQPFYFYGFLGRKPSFQKQELTALANHQETLIFYESPHRIAKTLVNMIEIFGPQREAVLARELTKKHEEFLRGTLVELQEWATVDNVRGEFVMMVAGNDVEEVDESLVDLSPIEEVVHLIEAGESTNNAIKRVAKRRQINRQDLYKEFHEI